MVYFTEIGTLHAPASFAHMAFFVNTTVWLAHCNQLHESTTNSSDWWLMAPVAEVCAELEDLPRGPPSSTRPKRQIAAIFGSLFGGVLLARLLFPGDSALVHRVDLVSRRVGLLEHKMQLFSDRLVAFESRVGDALTDLSLTVLHLAELMLLTGHKNALANLIAAATAGRLAHGFFSAEELRHALADFNAALAKKGFEAPVLSLSSLHELEASFATAPDGLMIYVHVPCVPRQTPPYRLLRYQQLPLAVPGFTMYIDIVSRAQYFAVSTSATASSVELTADDLRHCTKLGLEYFCPHVKVFSNTFAGTCLGAVYTADVPAIKAACFYRFTAGEFRIAMINDTAFMVSPRSNASYTVLWQCGPHHSRRALSGQSVIAVNSSCLVHVGNLSVDARSVQLALGYHSSYAWPASAAVVASHFHDEFAALAAAHDGPVSLDSTQLELPCEVPFWHLLFNGCLAAGLLCFVGYCVFAYIRECKK